MSDGVVGAVKVKPLVWVSGCRGYAAASQLGEYRVTAGNYTTKWVWETPESDVSGWHGLEDSDDAAKAAAQADYEARIMAALDVQPITVQDAAKVPEIKALIDAVRLVRSIDEDDDEVIVKRWPYIKMRAALRAIADTD